MKLNISERDVLFPVKEIPVMYDVAGKDKAENAGYKLLPKPKSFAPDGTIVPARAWLGEVSNRKAASLDELMAKATK